jgi:hypothetical protein
MKRHSSFNDEFYQMYQTTPNRHAPDRVWVVPGEGIHDLPETNFSPPLLMGYDHGVYYLLHHEMPAIMAFESDSFTPAMALRFANREYWEDCFGQDWWCPRTLGEIEVAIIHQSSKAHVFGHFADHRASWPYEEVEKRALSFDINEHRRWPPEDEPSDLVPIGYTKFIDIKFPEVRYIIPPFLTRPGLAMVFAERGVGKTLFVSHIAFAAATATSYLGWKAPRAFRVLILDGEMPAIELQKRYKAIESVTGIRPNPENLVFLTADLTPDGLPDLGTVEGQAQIEEHMEGFDLIIVDNLSTLCRTGAENEADSWGIMQQWAVRQRSLGRSVLLVHHAGKNGAQRGTSRREDVLGTVIQLKHPSGYTPTEGANFEIHFTKARGFFGLDAEPLEAQLSLDGLWTWQRLNEAKAADAVALYQEGKTMRDVAKELGVSSSTVSGYIKAAGIPTKPGRPPKNSPRN